jgi:hypothetical protein
MKIQKPESDMAVGESDHNTSHHAPHNPACERQTSPEKANLRTHAKIIQEREITNLIAEVEFGDWLIGERTEEPVASLFEKVSDAKAELSRSESLKIAEAVLFEFLTLQQAMLKQAEKARASH